MSLTVHSPVDRVESEGLGDILERVLDKGVVIAGDIAIEVVGVELLTIKLRLVIASTERAEKMGIDWWRRDPWLSSEAREDKRRLEAIDAVIDRALKERERVVESDPDET